MSKKKPQLPQDHAQVVAAAAQPRVEGVTFVPMQPIAPQSAVVLRVPDGWFDRAAAPDIAA